MMMYLSTSIYCKKCVICLDYKYDIIDIRITHFFINFIRYLTNFIYIIVYYFKYQFSYLPMINF